MTIQTVVAGVGMIPFAKPGTSESYDLMAARAIRAALADAGIGYRSIQQAYAGYVYGDSTSGQRALYHVGTTGIPVINVNNNCSSGSTALFLARQAVASGAADCVLAVGFEEMRPGALAQMFDDRPYPLKDFLDRMDEGLAARGIQTPDTPWAARLFGGAGMEYQEAYGTKPETFAKVAEKARRHAANNPNAVFRDPVTVAQVMESKAMIAPLTRLQCCPPTSGAAAAILCSRAFAEKNGIDPSIRIAGQAMVSDLDSSFSTGLKEVVGYDLSRAAAQQVYEQSGIGPDQVNVVELHDCFTVNEVLSYEALGLAEPGKAEQMIWDGDNTYGGRVVVNPSGGLLSKGHPLGATGLAQCAELVWQLRGQADQRQVEGARVALQHNMGLGGAVVVTLYER